MKRAAIFLYGVLSYIVFLVTFLYAVGFIGDLFVPKSMDAPPTVPFTTALLIDLALLGLFAVQHSVMARPGFKRWWTRIIPEAAERSTYVLFASVALIVLFVYWQPLGGGIWNVDSPAGRALLYAGFAFGWALVLLSTFLINHFDLFGLRQVWLQLVGKPYRPVEFNTPVIYRYVRHPLYLGFVFAIWCTPTMSATHLLFAAATTAYILIGIQLEERDLIDVHPQYREYRRRVPMLVPFMKRRRAAGNRIAVNG